MTSDPPVPLYSLPDLPARRARTGRWPRSESTKRAVLDAARVLFCTQGYDATSINDLVRASQVSVGSIYHQFGGKAEVYVALAKELLKQHAVASAKAVERARRAGESRPIHLYVAGARAYLMDTWEEREISRAMISDDCPPGYYAVRQEILARFIQGTHGLTFGEPPLPESTSYAITGLLHGAALQIVGVEDRRTARKIADYFTGLLLRLDDSDGGDGARD